MASTQDRLAQYEDLFAKSQQYDTNKFNQDFKKAYGEATNYNQDLIKQQAQSMGDLQAVAPTERERYSDSLITDPTAQRALIAQARQDPIERYATSSNLLNARGNKYSDILGTALGGYETAANQANTAAENQWRLYQDAVSQDQFSRQMAKGSGGSSSSNTTLEALLGLLTGEDTTTTTPTQTVKPSTREVVDFLYSEADRIKNLRGQQNIEDKMDTIHSGIIAKGREYGIAVDPIELWRRLGNT